MGMSCLLTVLLVAFVPLVVVAQNKCLYEACPSYEEHKLHVHLVCHTHDDMGWLKTVDQYYYGQNKSIQQAAVKYILNSVVEELQKDPRRRFTYVETGYFRKWWREQYDTMRHTVRNLVNNGQLEFSNGGWVSHDEAATHYMAMIDQMTLGHKQLNISFGQCGKPVTGWQIDPFGHSRENALLYAMMGLDSVFFARIDNNDRHERLGKKNMETIWKGSDDFVSNIFTGAFPRGDYGPPPGFCFDQFCEDPYLVDNKHSAEYNIDVKVKAFLDAVYKQASEYRTNHVMLTMGSDFHYQNANTWYSNLDKLMEHVNQGTLNGVPHNVTLHYSTPSCYVKAQHDSQTKFESKTSDFFPYSNANHSYWTGYFTSRPTYKGLVRMSNNFLQVCKQFDALADLGPSDFGDLDVLREAMAVAQHHDSITGTAKQHVSDDYTKRLHQGLMECQQVINDGVSKLTQTTASESFCLHLNVSNCLASTTSDEFTVRAFNGMSREQKTHLRIPVVNKVYHVMDSAGNNVSIDFKKIFPTNQLYYAKTAQYEIVFPVTLPALGYQTYSIKATANSREFLRHMRNNRRTRRRRSTDEAVYIENEFFRVDFGADGKLSQYKDVNASVTRIKQDFYVYTPVASGEPDDSKQRSGAYIFRPEGTAKMVADEATIVKVYKGSNYQEVWQSFANHVTQVVRLYKGSRHLELEWTVGPIPVDEVGKIGGEIVSRFDSDVGSGDTFYTDANGRQLMKRVRNARPDFTYDNGEPVSGNYYPVNTRISIKDSSKQLAVLNDRSQGGSSLKSGSVELMVHRRLLVDDGYGVNEALNETGPSGKGLVARGRHWLLISPLEQGARLHRAAAEEMFNTPVLTFSKGAAKDPKQFKGLTADLPANAKIVTLEQWHANSILLRLEHTFQKGEDTSLSGDVTVDLQGMFKQFAIDHVDELTLSANRDLDERPKLVWNGYPADTKPSPLSGMKVTLRPMEIRTFMVTRKA